MSGVALDEASLRLTMMVDLVLHGEDADHESTLPERQFAALLTEVSAVLRDLGHARKGDTAPEDGQKAILRFFCRLEESSRGRHAPSGEMLWAAQERIFQLEQQLYMLRGRVDNLERARARGIP